MCKLTARQRSSGPSDSLAPPPSPYPQQIEPSPVDSNGTESTEIDEEAQDDSGVRSPRGDANGEIQSPDIEITSPQSANSVSKVQSHPYGLNRTDVVSTGPSTKDQHSTS